MTFFVGHAGAIKLQRSGANTFITSVLAEDINTSLNRFSFDDSDRNIVTGDFLEITTEDVRGLLFIPGSPSDVRGYVQINQAGGIRLFENFDDAINNDRASEYTLAAFTGNPIEITINIRDTKYNTLGSVTSFEINTDRGAIETTSLSDSFKQQYSAGLLSGNGSIECLFSYEAVPGNETPLFLLQVINRIDVGSSFKSILSLASTEKLSGSREDVFYEIEAVVTRAGVTVTSDALVACSIDFVTTGEFKLRVGVPSEYILKEDADAIYLEQSLDYLLQEVTD